MVPRGIFAVVLAYTVLPYFIHTETVRRTEILRSSTAVLSGIPPLLLVAQQQLYPVVEISTPPGPIIINNTLVPSDNIRNIYCNIKI